MVFVGFSGVYMLYLDISCMSAERGACFAMTLLTGFILLCVGVQPYVPCVTLVP